MSVWTFHISFHTVYLSFVIFLFNVIRGKGVAGGISQEIMTSFWRHIIYRQICYLLYLMLGNLLSANGEIPPLASVYKHRHVHDHVSCIFYIQIAIIEVVYRQFLTCNITACLINPNRSYTFLIYKRKTFLYDNRLDNAVCHRMFS